MLRDIVVVDVETAERVENPAGWRALKSDARPDAWDRTDLMGVGVAVVYECRFDRFAVYDKREVHKLRQRLQAADEIVGFNVWGFDLPVIYGVARPDWPTHKACRLLTPRINDILQRVWAAKGLDPWKWTPRHKGWKLDALARGTLGRGKLADGGLAPGWLQMGWFAPLITYCIDDVALTRDLDRFAARYGYVLHGDTGEKVHLPPWSPATPPAAA